LVRGNRPVFITKTQEHVLSRPSQRGRQLRPRSRGRQELRQENGGDPLRHPQRRSSEADGPQAGQETAGRDLRVQGPQRQDGGEVEEQDKPHFPF